MKNWKNNTNRMWIFNFLDCKSLLDGEKIKINISRAHIDEKRMTVSKWKREKELDGIKKSLKKRKIARNKKKMYSREIWHEASVRWKFFVFLSLNSSGFFYIYLYLTFSFHSFCIFVIFFYIFFFSWKVALWSSKGAVYTNPYSTHETMSEIVCYLEIKWR